MSKGLAAPIGSLVVGTQEFIRQAKRLKKVVGGGMRQIGILAATGIISLIQMPKLLKLDHQNAKLLAEGLSKIDGCEINPEKDVQTNIVFFVLNSIKIKIDAPTLTDILKREYGILLSAQGKWKCRLLTHYIITQENIEYVLEQMKNLLEKNQI